MRLRDQYDWIVLGHHPGALLSASLVARLGLSVLVLPFGPHQMFQISRTGQSFDPESNYLIGLGHSEKGSGLIFHCLKALGFFDQVENLAEQRGQKVIQPLDPQVLTPQTRFVLSLENLHSEMMREFVNSRGKAFHLAQAMEQTRQECLSYWTQLPSRLIPDKAGKKSSASVQGPVDLEEFRRHLGHSLDALRTQFAEWPPAKTKASELAHKTEKSDLQEVFSGLWYSITLGINEDPHLVDIIHILNLSLIGSSYRGGLSAYRAALMNLARRFGVHVPINTDCRRLFVEKGRFAGVQIANRGNMISTGGGILGCSLDPVFQKVTYTGQNWFHRKKRMPIPIGWKFTLALTVHEEVIPPKMLPRIVWQEKDAPILEIEVVSPKDYGMREDNNRIIYIRSLMPFEQRSLDLDYQKLIAGRMLRQAIEIIPFLEFHILRIFPDFREGLGRKGTFRIMPSKEESPASTKQKVEDFSEVYGFSSLEGIPDNLRVYSGRGVGASSGIDGLYVASDQSYPELGGMGGTVAAFEAVAAMSHRLGMDGPFSSLFPS